MKNKNKKWIFFSLGLLAVSGFFVWRYIKKHDIDLFDIQWDSEDTLGV